MFPTRAKFDTSRNKFHFDWGPFQVDSLLKLPRNSPNDFSSMGYCDTEFYHRMLDLMARDRGCIVSTFS